MDKEQIDQKYLDQANQLETEFFDIVNEGSPSQHRVLKEFQTIWDFNAQHATIWQNHQQELIDNGYLKPTPPRPPSPDIVRATELLATSPQVITMPEMWELMRIFGRLHGISF